MCIQAVARFDDKVVGVSVIYVGRAQPKSERQAELKETFEHRDDRQDGVSLFVRYFDDIVDEERLRMESSR